PLATLVLGASAVAAFLPQMVVWRALYGSPFRPPRGEASGAFLDPHRLHVADVLLSWRHGIVSWHPVLRVRVAGLARPVGLHRRARAPVDPLACAGAGADTPRPLDLVGAKGVLDRRSRRAGVRSRPLAPGAIKRAGAVVRVRCRRRTGGVRAGVRRGRGGGS